MTPTILFLVPARSGSKGVLKKNIALVGGRPMIEWTISAAQSSKYLSRLIVSTDSSEIADLSRLLGGEVPFLRPCSLSTDYASSLDVAAHALGWLEREERYLPDYVLLLQPTSPLRISNDIDGAITVALEKDASALVSVSPVSCHPFWMREIGESGELKDFIKQEGASSQRQGLPKVFGLNGAIYLIKRRVLLEQRSWYPENTLAFVMPPERAIDVDTQWDMHLADLILRERNAALKNTG